MRRKAIALLAGSVLAALSAICAPAQAEVRVNADQAGASATLQVRSWKDIPFRSVVRQKYDFSCGSAALATLLKYHYNVQVDETIVFANMWKTGDQVKIRKVGFSMLDMKRVLHAHNMEADGFRVSLDKVEQAKTPAIALITIGRYRHFVVIKGVRDGKVLVGDPAQGLKIYKRSDFEKMWNGIAFVVHDRKEKGPPPAFNRDSEWRPWTNLPLEYAVDRSSIATFTEALPPIYQITPQVTVPTS
jgi:uncharacterized protein